MPSTIKVILQKGVENLGAGGDTVKVRPGFARNFLIPRGLAVMATEGNLARVDELKRVAQRHAEQELEEAQQLKAKLEAQSVKMERAAGEDGKMYGSVTSKDIAEVFAAQGMKFDRRKLELSEPIKQLGLAEVPVKLHSEVSAVLRVEVVKASS
jgi:large subunit ribosomal protein L9